MLVTNMEFSFEIIRETHAAMIRACSVEKETMAEATLIGYAF